ncbi:putative mfs monocarboxylate protein [Eutypa lata UCREL1]|uniref:Putative mfs monocarboxylate protein n=1 Tax=Eutypa lata (strain UCR-EL1) TaxID=1287681 RepID=M7SYQ3_EUTLA|nr:putative mfs monocarboxylate protein [Eutypa lata UCREL1]
MVFNTWGTIITFGDYQAYYERGTLFTESSANISWIGSIQSLMVFVVGAVIGPLYDRGHLKLLLLAGTFGIVFGHMMLSLCTEYWQVVLAQGLVVGIGGGCIFVPALAVVQPYFSTRLGLALGIVATGSSLGGIIYPIVFINLIDKVGFAWTTRAIGFIALATLIIPLAISEMRVKPPTARKMIDFSAFTDGPFMLCILGCFLGYAGSHVSFFYIAFYGQANGWMTGTLALYLLPILNSASAVGRVLPNWLADKIGPINVVIPGSLIIGVILLCNLAVANAGGLICTALFFGFLSGIFVATPPLLFMVLTKDKTKLGARMGMAYALVGLSVLPGGPGAGAVLQHDWNRLDWAAAWTYAGILPLSAFAVFCALRLWQTGPKLLVKA